MDTLKVDIFINGAGIPGLTLAILAADFGINCAIADINVLPSLKEIKPSNHTSALMQSSITILKKTGTWEDCQPYTAPLEILRIVDGNVTTDFNARDIGQDFFALNAPNNIVKAALADKARAHPKITLFESNSLKSYETNAFSVHIKLENNEALEADLLVGADGRNSKTRALANISVKSINHKQAALTCVIEHTKPHHNISTEFYQKSGPFTLVPLPGDKSSIVWIDTRDNISSYTALQKSLFEKKLQYQTQNALGTIKLIDNPMTWPLNSQNAKSITRDKVVLIAEAAHTLTPIGAQGLNLSLRDVNDLLLSIQDMRTLGYSAGSTQTLEEYSRKRAQDIALRVHGTNMLNQVISMDIEPIKRLRQLGLKTIDSLGPLKSILMIEGMGFDKEA